MWMGTYHRNLLLKKLFDLHGDNALEIGCHDGFLLHNIPAKKKIGIDIEIIKKYPKIKYIEADFLDYDFKKKIFDIILAIEVLEHIKYPDKFLKKLNNISSKNGKTLLSTPSKNVRIFPYVFQSYIDRRWGHYYRRGFSFDELKDLLDKNITNKNYKIIQWNCPFWRIFYLPLRFLWKIFPGLTKKISSLLIDLDLKFKKGNHGFFYILIY